MLTPVLVSFLTTYPKVTVDLVEKDDAQLEEAVISGELDCAVITPWGSSAGDARSTCMTEEILLVGAGRGTASPSSRRCPSPRSRASRCCSRARP